MNSDGGFTLAAEFPVAESAQWRDLVAKVLKGADFERRLVRRTHDAIVITPLYGALDAGPDVGLPGAAPFTRGNTAAGTVAGGWDVRQHHGHPDPAVLNAQILEDLERGVTSIQLQIDGTMAHELPRALTGVHLDLAPIGLAAGSDVVPVAEALLQRLRGQRADEVVYAPEFRREIEEPVAGAIPVLPGTPLLVAEGNYLLLDDGPWARVRPLLDEVWYVDVDDALRVTFVEHAGRVAEATIA